MTYYKQIDSFRFFAAFSVVVAHWLHYVPSIDRLRLGYLGVDFFFVISGFLISFQLFELAASVKQQKIGLFKAISNFIIRRGLRIFPLYYLVLILATAFNQGEIRDAFLYNLAYISNFYFIKVQHWNSIFSHFWSLSVEEHFYIVWPLILLAINRKFMPVVMVGIAVFSITFRYFSYIATNDFFTTHIHTLSCLDLFMFGGILAYFLYSHKVSFKNFFAKQWVKYIILLGLAISYVALISVEDSPIFILVFFRAIFGLFSAGLIGLLVVGFNGIAGRIFEHKWLIIGGKLSYAIYLLHNFVPGLLLGIKKLELPIFVEFVIYFSATILFSMILHKLVENPARRLGKNFKIKFA